MFGISPISKKPFATLGVQVFVININENGNAIDTSSKSMSATASVSESGLAISTQSETMSALVFVAEAGNAVDVVSENMTAFLTMNETATAFNLCKLFFKFQIGVFYITNLSNIYAINDKTAQHSIISETDLLDINSKTDQHNLR